MVGPILADYTKGVKLRLNPEPPRAQRAVDVIWTPEQKTKRGGGRGGQDDDVA